MIELKKTLFLCILIFYSLFSADNKKNMSMLPSEGKKNNNMEKIKTNIFNIVSGIHVFEDQDDTVLDMIAATGIEKKNCVVCDGAKIASVNFNGLHDADDLRFKDEKYVFLLKKWLCGVADNCDSEKYIDLKKKLFVIKNSHYLDDSHLQIIYNMSFLGVPFLVSGKNNYHGMRHIATTFLYSVADEIYSDKKNTKELTQQNDGSIQVICGPMFGGKTSRLIDIGKKAQQENKNIIVVKHAFDEQRYKGIHELVSHKEDHERIFATLCTDTKEFEKLIENKNYIDMCIIDEIQFFDYSIIPIIEKMKAQGVTVVVGGLDLDFRGVPFQFTLPYLLSIADVVTKVKSICEKSHSIAQYSQRLINGMPAKATDPIVLPGGKECYQPRSRECFDIDRIPVNEWCAEYSNFLEKFKAITHH